jgi:hypothetical protein
MTVYYLNLSAYTVNITNKILIGRLFILFTP